jgi:hypothetical protein
MLRYLKWLSIAGIWLPIFVLATWVLISWSVIAINPTSGGGWGLTVIGVFLTFAFSHLLAISSAIGFGLLITRQVEKPAFTLVSAVTGGLISAFVFSRIYFGVAS